MQCEVCGKDFTPVAEVERLMLTGNVAKLCPVCEKSPIGGYGLFDPSARPFAEKHVRTKHSVLHRVDRFEADGRVQRWMALYPRFQTDFEKRLKSMAPHRQTNLVHPFVMTERDRHSSVPRLFIKTNMWVYQLRGQPLRVWKTSRAWDAVTGVGEIEIPAVDVVRIEDDGGLELRVVIRDGGYLRMLYRVD